MRTSNICVGRRFNSRRRWASILLASAIAMILPSCSALTEVDFYLKTTEKVNEGVPFQAHVFQLKDKTKFESMQWKELLRLDVGDFGKVDALGDAFIGEGLQTADLESGDSSLSIKIKLSSGAKFIGLFGRFKSDAGTPKIAFPVEVINGATVVVKGFSFEKQEK